jgi:hypothetical protein
LLPWHRCKIYGINTHIPQHISYRRNGETISNRSDPYYTMKLLLYLTFLGEMR